MPHLNKLQRLVDFLRTLKPWQFKMDRWSDGVLSKDCGTAGCALGWGTVIFDEIELVLIDDWRGKSSHIVQFTGERGLGRCKGYDAAAALFKIPMEDSLQLFSPDHYDPRTIATVEVVTERMETYIAVHSQ